LKTIQQPQLTVSSLQDRRAALASSLRVRIPPANVQQALPIATGSAHEDSEFASSPVASTGNADGSLSTSLEAMSSSLSSPSSNEDETDADGESLPFSSSIPYNTHDSPADVKTPATPPNSPSSPRWNLKSFGKTLKDMTRISLPLSSPLAETWNWKVFGNALAGSTGIGIMSVTEDPRDAYVSAYSSSIYDDASGSLGLGMPNSPISPVVSASPRYLFLRYSVVAYNYLFDRWRASAPPSIRNTVITGGINFDDLDASSG
jgi:hypothetical protein